MKQFVSGAFFGVAATSLLLPAAYALSREAGALDTFADAFSRVEKNYVQEVDPATLTDSALHGMLSGLDAHSSYMDAQEYADAQGLTANSGFGVGVELTKENGVTKVIAPIDNAPAALGGVRPGDNIFSIDGKSTDSLPLDAIVMKLRGPEGSKVTLGVQHGLGMPVTEVVLTRQRIKTLSVSSDRKGNVGYIHIRAFNTEADNDLRTAVSNLKKQIGPSLTGYVIDLRNDPGGLLDQGIAVSDEFLVSGNIVSLHGRNSADNQSYDAHPGDIADGKPIIVLINEGSAADSEIVAGALQDNGRAKIVGTRSFGVGTVQTIIPLSQGHGALRLTTAKFYTPSGRAIDGVGVTPDVIVPAGGYLAGKDDPQLVAALARLNGPAK